ncbi:hypothetical protein PJP07_30530, partial [Mycobacterium kansasii]
HIRVELTATVKTVKYNSSGSPCSVFERSEVNLSTFELLEGEVAVLGPLYLLLSFQLFEEG